MGTSRFQDWWGYWEWGARVGASWNWSSCAIGGVLWCLGLCWLVSLLGFGSVHFPVLWPFSLGAPDASMGLLGFFPHFMLVFWLLGLCYWLRPPGFSRCMWVLSLFGYLNSGNSGWEMRCPHRTVYLIVWSYLCLCFHPWLNVWFYVTSSSNLKVFTGPQFGMKNPSSDIKKIQNCILCFIQKIFKKLDPWERLTGLLSWARTTRSTSICNIKYTQSIICLLYCRPVWVCTSCSGLVQHVDAAVLTSC